MLVPDEHYAAVSDWINAHHLGGRLVYYRVPAAAGGPRRRQTSAAPRWRQAGRQGLAVRLLAGPGAAHRADHECVETMAEFRRRRSAITKAGQVKGAGGRHEKDDRFRIDDRSRYVLGWSNERKIDAAAQPGRGPAGNRSPRPTSEPWTTTPNVQAAIARGQIARRAWTQTTEFAEID